METPLKQRLIGAAVLAALAIIFLPMLLKGPDIREPDATEVPLSMPQAPNQEFETRELPLTAPDAIAPPGGVLGMAPAPAPAPAPAAPAADAQAPDDLAVEGQTPPPAEAEAVGALPAMPTPATPTLAKSAVPTPAKPAAAPAPASADNAAVAGGNYVVSVGSFSNLGNAEALAGRLRAARLPVTADRVALAAGPALRIRVGPYADRASAEAARLRTETVTGSATRVVALDAATAAVKPSAAPAATPAAPKPTTSTVGFVVQLSAPSVEKEALALRDKARANGFTAFVQRVESEGGTRFRVRVGPVADRAEAQALLGEISGKLGIKGIVVVHP